MCLVNHGRNPIRCPPLLSLQVESDIAPYKGLLMGLFFMSVGMEISVQLFIAKWKEVLAAITILIVGKVRASMREGGGRGRGGRGRGPVEREGMGRSEHTHTHTHSLTHTHTLSHTHPLTHTPSHAHRSRSWPPLAPCSECRAWQPSGGWVS